MYGKQASSYVFRIHQETGYQVMFRGKLCRPTFQDKAGADTYLDSLERGREPEYAEAPNQKSSTLC
jgi:hypothetical protein